jgi:hypothetical protein
LDIVNASDTIFHFSFPADLLPVVTSGAANPSGAPEFTPDI